jgi:hypothetical protein
VRLNDVTVSVATADQSMTNLFYRFYVSDRIRGCVWAAIARSTEWQRIGNQIDAAMIFARAGFVCVHGILVHWRLSQISMALRTRPRVIGFFGSSRLTKRFGPRYFTRNLRGSQFARALLERACEGYEEVTVTDLN